MNKSLRLDQGNFFVKKLVFGELVNFVWTCNGSWLRYDISKKFGFEETKNFYVTVTAVNLFLSAKHQNFYTLKQYFETFHVLIKIFDSPHNKKF